MRHNLTVTLTPNLDGIALSLQLTGAAMTKRGASRSQQTWYFDMDDALGLIRLLNIATGALEHQRLQHALSAITA